MASLGPGDTREVVAHLQKHTWEIDELLKELAVLKGAPLALIQHSLSR